LAGSEQLVKRAKQFRDLDQMTVRDSIFIGLAQGLALIPGISRSGSTIAAGLSRGIRRDEAARFSFYLGTPAILGAGLLQTAEVTSLPGVDIGAMAPELIAGFLAAAITGVIAIRLLLAYLRKHSLNVFAIYCAVVGLLTIVVSFVR
jgi:undecaprenyl-diphosphatase